MFKFKPHHVINREKLSSIKIYVEVAYGQNFKWELVITHIKRGGGLAYNVYLAYKKVQIKMQNFGGKNDKQFIFNRFH